MSGRIPWSALALMGSICLLALATVHPGPVVTVANAALSDYQRITIQPKPPPGDIVVGNQDLPVLVNTGIESCPPCQRMASSLLELQTEYGHVFQTYYYDTQKVPEALTVFQALTVPTQIFYAADGTELHRNEGFLAKHHILEQWRELGMVVQPAERSASVWDWLSFENLLSSLTLAVRGAAPTALLAAFFWGVLSIVLSPCHLAGIPLIVGYINGQKVETSGRAISLSLLFGLGILGSIVIVGIISASAGRLLGDLGPLPYYILSGVFILFGLNLTGLVPMGCLVPNRLLPKAPGKRGALALGLVLGIGLGPCTFVYMAPILGLTMAMAATDLYYGLVLLLLFAVGHCLFLMLASMSPRFIQFFLRWNERSLSAPVLKKVCGALLILGGAYLAYTA
ncbi:Cytochrome c biogenesis protein CcdA [Desulfonatronum thiosulfatophilum]|uniref:Cytochrome c biogenesis protein CcdA n=1 Tax=Desulfonatronum thiosulfatophilum TaxID=617002 RepID=A0A1G6E7J8_9BACT|nr:cytochrome c biogenesis protein CcdA [Desulfonatronum thiosulfatophilum]SDB53322.1 Cytochrome c biogenesis protein CcdA [Desulfonatronum thiosulfatophilum]